MPETSISNPNQSQWPNAQEDVIEIAIVGAGLAGLACAQRLQRAGYRVILLEKSRGLGGRVATRRLPDTCADHGLRWLEAQGPQSQRLVEALLGRGLEPWTGQVYQWLDGNLTPTAASPRYVAADGMTVIAKHLGAGLEIWRGQRVTAVSSSAHGWSLTLESLEGEGRSLSAQAIVMAIPAPQALTLLQPLAAALESELLDKLAAVQFNPCITAIARFSAAERDWFDAPPWSAVNFPENTGLHWVSIDSTKGRNLDCPVLVMQSSPAFAEMHLEAADLAPIGNELLQKTAMHLLPGLPSPPILQVHRWRYATVRSPYSQTCLSTNQPAPLVLAGDWCGLKEITENQNHSIEQALVSGVAAAEAINTRLSSRTLPEWDYSAPSSAPVPLRF
ncbi:MAG: FAD-dependent oxidoreductase [Cyanobacteria bacterium J069]|nr:MAG: FAD-dependent oxidoreductase [Cyanobacteria bacterium J069]